ncbi:MAG: leucyl aminopeptidase family protein, partial [Gammaproteobacteria bacterium]|nr:leucyl aminopeptidase family protein [Gammaproteobacteria bacterium]
HIKNIITLYHFSADDHQYCLLTNAEGVLAKVIVGVKDKYNLWSLANLSLTLPEKNYQISAAEFTQLAIGWGLGAYQFTRYKAAKRQPAKLVLNNNSDIAHICNTVESIYWVRDLINIPPEDMLPQHLASEAEKLAAAFAATITIIKGDDLLTQNYPSIHAVGRASVHTPRLIDLRWGNPQHKKITLIGKGVCFDSGGLDIKTASGMLSMKKDMGGAAHALGLARMIMAEKLPVCLRVLVPAVENAIAGNAYHPSDVIKTRKGLTVEVTNTDAEGRLILCDALAEACTEQPDLLIDFATLTGASRVALGAEIANIFCDNKAIVQHLVDMGEQLRDPIYPLPLYKDYRYLLDSDIADLCSANVKNAYAGAITAALFLNEFVDSHINWIHLDLMGASIHHKPGRPVGGDAQSLRAILQYLRQFITE